jgi:tetratricopeptide (TPR) repeat protein
MARTPFMPPVLTGLLLLTVAELLVVAALVQGWWPAAGMLHLAACAALPFLPGGGAEARHAAALRVVRILLPTLGPAVVAGAWLALALALVLDRGRAGAAPGEPPEDPVEARLAAVADARALPAGLLLEALGDALRWGTGRQRVAAIDLAVHALRPGTEALLRLALADPDPKVRAHAEAALPVLERGLMRQAAALRRGAPRALARHLDNAAFSGLLDPARAASCRTEAMEAWRRVVQEDREDGEALAALGRDLLALGRLEEARAALEDALSRSVATPAILGWLAECLFRLRDIAALEALVGRWEPMLAQEARGASPLAPAWRLWLGQRS